MKERKRDVKVEKLRITEEMKEEREGFPVIKAAGGECVLAMAPGRRYLQFGDVCSEAD